MNKQEMAALRLAGETYAQIAKRAGLSRQRIQVLISPPKAIRAFIFEKYANKCNKCGIPVGHSGHIHHRNNTEIEDYNDINNLELLCISCHREAHFASFYEGLEKRNAQVTTGDAKYLKPEEYAQKYRIHLNTVYNLLNAGKIKDAFKIGDQWRIPETSSQ